MEEMCDTLDFIDFEKNNSVLKQFEIKGIFGI